MATMRKARGRRAVTKTLCAAVAATLAFGAAACGGGSGAADSPDGKVSLTFWHGFTEADGKAIEKIVRDFNSANPDIEIKTQVNPWDVIADKMLPAISAGQGPDIVAQPATAAVAYATKGAFQPLDDFYDDKANETSQLVPGAVEASKVEGKPYGVPLAFGPVSLYYNKKLFAEQGITEPPTTWDEWTEVARKLTIDGNKDGTPEQYGLAMSNHGPLSAVVWSGLFRSNGGDVVQNGKAVVDSPANKETLSYWQDVVRDDKIMPANLDDTSASDLYASKKAAMHVSGVWMALRSKESDIDYGIAPVPAGPVKNTSGANALSMYLTAQAEGEKAAAAKKFFAFFNSKEQQVAWSVEAGWPPNRVDVRPDELTENPDVAKFAEFSRNAELGFSGVVDFAGVSTEFDTLTQKTINGENIASIVRSAQQKIQGKLGDR